MSAAGRGAQPAGRADPGDIFTTNEGADQTPQRPLYRLQNDLRQLEIEQDASRKLVHTYASQPATHQLSKAQSDALIDTFKSDNFGEEEADEVAVDAPAKARVPKNSKRAKMNKGKGQQALSPRRADPNNPNNNVQASARLDLRHKPSMSSMNAGGVTGSRQHLNYNTNA